MVKQIKYYLLLIFILGCGKMHALDYDSLYHKSLRLQYISKDSAIHNFNSCLPYFESKNDSSTVIDINLRLASMYSGNGNYQKAFDIAWELLPYIQNSRFDEQKINLNLKLINLYIIFSQFDKARYYLEQAIPLCECILDEKLKSLWLSRLYGLSYRLALKDKSDFETAEQYALLALNECKKTENEYYIIYSQMRLAELYIMIDSLDYAQNYLRPGIQKFKNKSVQANSLLFDHLGQLFMKKNEYDSAVYYFRKSIRAIDKFQNHRDNKVEVLDSMSRCYFYLGRLDSAYHYALKSTQTSDILFGNKSKMNRELFELKDDYQKKIEAERFKLLEQEKELLRVRSLIYISIFISLILIITIILIIRTKKQTLFQAKQEHEKQQKEFELESKNKELVTSSLQLIERDALLDGIRDHLKSMDFKQVNKKIMDEIIASIHSNKIKKWDEFEMHFTNVNNDFYAKIKSIYPDLSNKDLKMCALMKLGLSSKEMADIMAIESRSVDVSRSRIRKKMDLAREVNLLEHLRAL